MEGACRYAGETIELVKNVNSCPAVSYWGKLLDGLPLMANERRSIRLDVRIWHIRRETGRREVSDEAPPYPGSTPIWS